MATNRSTIEVEVIGLAGLQQLNMEMTKHEALLRSVLTVYSQFGAAQQSAATSTKAVTLSQQQLNAALQTTSASMTAANRPATSLLGTFLQYRAISLVFQGITRTIGDTVKAMEAYDKQVARTTRIIGTENRPLVASTLRAGTASTGLDPKTAGETYYQLATILGKTGDQVRAFRSEMDLLAGTEGDARETTRLSLQIYEQFGEQLGKNVDNGEKMRRANELIAGSFKGAAAEVGEIAQALKYLGPIAETARVPLAQVFALVTTLTAQGVRGRMEGTEAGAFLARLIKSYDPAQGGVVYKDNVYKFKQVTDDKGQLDMLKTLEGIYRNHQALLAKDAQSAKEYYVAIGGSAQAIRFLGAMTDDTFSRMGKETEANTRRIAGQTDEVKRLKDAMMDTFSAQSSRAWEGFLGAISASLDDVARKLHIIGGLRDLATSFQGAADVRQADVLRGQALATQQPVMHALEMQSIARNALRLMGGQSSMELGNLESQMRAPDYGALRTLLHPTTIPGNRFMQVTREDLQRVVDSIQTQIPALIARERAGRASGTTAGGSRLSFRVGADRARMNPNLLADLEAVAAEQGVTIQVGTAITGHRERTTTGNISRHVAGNAVDITSINGQSVLVGTPGEALADKLLEGLKGRGYGFGESNDRAFLYKTMIGGNHFNHLHVSDRDRSGAQMGDLIAPSAKAKEKAEKEAERAARDAQKDAEQRARDAEDARKNTRDTAMANLELTKRRYGPDDVRTWQAARSAQDAEARLARDFGSPADLIGLSDGPLPQLLSEIKDARLKGGGFTFNQRQPFVLPYLDQIAEYQQRQQAERDRTYTMQSEAQGYSVAGITGGLDARLRGLQGGLRPNNIYGNRDAAEGALLSQTVSALQEAIKQLQAIPDATPKTLEELDRLRERLQAANGELQNFKDKLVGQRIEEFVGKLETRYSEQARKRQLSELPVSAGDQRAAQEQFMEDMIAIATRRASDLTGLSILYGGKGGTKEAAKAALNDAEAQQAALRNRRMQEYYGQYDQIQGEMVGSGVQFLRGRGSLGNVFQGAGDTIINTALGEMLKHWTDPLVTSATVQVRAIEGNTDSLRQLATVLQGGTATGPGVGGKAGGLGDAIGVAAGGAAVAAMITASKGGSLAGLAAGGAAVTSLGGTPPFAPGGSSGGGANAQAGQILAKAMAGYSLFAQGQQGGAGLGSILGAGLSGFELGGPIGAIAGVGLNLLGSLFRSKPTVNPQNIGNNPALVNSPGDMDYYAYRYRATGQLPSGTQLNGYKAPAPTVVNVYMDSVKQAVRTEVAAQGSTSEISRSSHYYDLHRPL